MSYGFKPWGPLLSCKRFNGDGRDNAAIFVNDVVAFDEDQNGYVTAAQAVTTACVGVSLTYLAAATTASVAVANDPDQLLQTTHDGTATQAQIGLTGDLVQTAAGNTNTRLSGQDLDTSTLNVAGTNAQFTLLEHVQREDNAIGAGTESIVSFTTEHVRRVNTGIA